MKRIISILMCLVLFLSAMTLSFGTKAAEMGSNLIANPSFEQNSGWGFGSLYRTTDKAHSGSYALKSSARGVTVLVSNGSKISVKQNTDYLFSGYIYRSDNSAWAYIDMNDATGELQLLNTESYGKWQYVTGIWNSGSSTSVTPRIVVEPNYTINQHQGAGVTGDIWFDDISLKELSYPAYSEAGATLSANAKSYSLKNTDISVTLTTDQNKEYITELKNLESGHNWVSGAQEIPLTDKYSNGNLSWTLKNAQLNNSKKLTGTGEATCHTLTLTYSGNISGLSLKSVYMIFPTGPLYHYCEIINGTGKTLEFNSSDLVIADTNFSAPSNLTLYRFNRSRFNNGFDGNFKKGVFEDKIGTNGFYKTVTENSWLLSSGMLPFTVMQGNDEGFYIGYEWSYGEAILRTQSNSKKFKLSASLGISDDTITRENGETLLIPPVFFGAYKGDIDEGSNQMKGWFYNHLMTASLRENANEPPIELHLPLFAENDLKGYLYDCDLEDWGVELTKMDYWWTVPSNSGFDAYLEQQWNPNSNKWPSGMTYGKLVKEAYPSVKTSLYMADTYQGVDIGTDAGREKQINALKERLSNWQIDYWRSDFDLLKPNNYQNHEGLMYILDELTAWSDDFRYEHCSAGGSLKDFSTLRRMTFMTMEDSGGALNHRMAFYSNSYMINPVQLKFDMGFDWRPADSNEQNLINSNQQEWITYNVRTAMMGAMMIQNVSRRLNGDELSALKEGWALYKDKQRPILKGADVYHILPMPTGNSLDGMQFYNNSIEEGSVFIFRDTGGETSKQIKLKGLDENATYKLTFEDRTNLNCEKTGKELMETGVYVSGLTSVYDSEIIWIEKTSKDIPTTPTEPQTQPLTQPTTATNPTDPEESTSATDATTTPEDDKPIVIPTVTTATDAYESTPTTAPSSSPIVIVPTTSNTTTTGELGTTIVVPAEYVILGDTDFSGKVSIKDATLIQKYIAKIETLDEKAVFASDVDASGVLNIRDVTNIQKWLAKYNIQYKVGEQVLYKESEVITNPSDTSTAPDSTPEITPTTTSTTPSETDATEAPSTVAPTQTPAINATEPTEHTTEAQPALTEPTPTQPSVTDTIYFVDGTPEGWIGDANAKVYIYNYETAKSYSGTQQDDSTWIFTVPSGMTSINFYRCEGEFTTSAWNSWTACVSLRGTETTFIATSNEAGYWSGSSSDGGNTEVSGNYIYVQDDAGWGSVYCHSWSSTQSTTWPGVQMEAMGNNFYRISIDSTHTGVVFNNGNGTQTADLSPQWGKTYNNSTNSWS